MKKFKLWNDSLLNTTEIMYYPSTYKTSRAAVIIFPGGAYLGHAEYEGKGYAEVFNMFGMSAFVVNYRVAPNNRFPTPLIDARRAVRFLRAHYKEFDIDKDKILVIGSSAGGHLAALLSTYTNGIAGESVDEIDEEDFLPNGQILCYPVICSDESIGHVESYMNLLGDRYEERNSFSPELLVKNNTPKAFIWHTSTDSAVSVVNSYRYAEALYRNNVQCEMHIFPMGDHGCGVSPHIPYVSSWVEMLRKWLIFNNF